MRRNLLDLKYFILEIRKIHNNKMKVEFHYPSEFYDVCYKILVEKNGLSHIDFILIVKKLLDGESYEYFDYCTFYEYRFVILKKK